MVLQIVILAGGRGGSLYPLTTHIPKMILPISNKPMIVYVLEMLERSECKFCQPIIILTQRDYEGKLSKSLETRYKVMSENSFEIIGVPEEYRGTVGSLRYLLSSPHIAKGNNELLVISSDLLLDFSVLPLYINNFRLSQSDCSVLTHAGKASYDYMQVFALNHNKIVQIFESVDNEEGFTLPIRTLQKFPRICMRNDLIQDYCYLIKTNLLKNLLDDPKTERFYKFKDELIPYLLKKQLSFKASVEVYVVPEGNYSKRSNDIRSYMEVNIDCCFPLTGKDKFGQVLKPLPLILLSTPNTPKNTLTNFYRAGAVQIPNEFKQVSNDCIIQEEFKIGEKTVINKSIIGKNIRIGNRCKIIGSIIMDNVVIEDNANINNSIIGSQASIGTGCKVINSQMASGSIIQPGDTLKDDIALSII
jgi:translation initiation factor eIF-2B subunit gamma